MRGELGRRVGVPTTRGLSEWKIREWVGLAGGRQGREGARSETPLAGGGGRSGLGAGRLADPSQVRKAL